jgi:hypothetical protein
MRYLFGFMCVLALGVMGCGETTGTGGSGGSAGDGGAGGGMPECQSPEDCDDDQECTTDTCADGTCEVAPVEDGTACDESNECTVGTCASGTCESTPVTNETACGDDAGTCQDGSCQVACSEQGIRDAIAAGGGPYTFECAGPQTVVTAAEIVIDNDVILDGEGNLIVDGNDDHIVFFVAEGATVELVGFVVTRGRSDGGPPDYRYGGGGIFAEGTLTLTNCTVTRCTATENVDPERFNSGGGVWSSGSLTLTNSTVSENSADFGGGGVSSYGNLTLTNSIVSGNSAAAGGGIWHFYGTLTMTNSTVSGNTATSPTLGSPPGGGIHNRGSGTISKSTISENTGAGVYSQVDPPTGLTITNSTISGNTGGGIRNHSGMLVLTNNTVSGSISVGSGGDEVSSIVAAATLIDGACTREGDNVTWVSNGYNIESPGDTCGFDPDGTDQVDVSAEALKLGELADNGGPTMTHALGAGSVAIDVIPADMCVDAEGEPLTTDQRGEPRPGGTMCDMGAFEVQP